MKKSQLANRFRENHDRIENTNLINLIHMKVYKTKEIKNISLLGSDGAGKTTLTEALLYESGQIQRRGRIEDHCILAFKRSSYRKDARQHACSYQQTCLCA